jgi:hypothetical protein
VIDDRTNVAHSGRGRLVVQVLAEEQCVRRLAQPLVLVAEQLGRAEVRERAHHAAVCL